MDTFDNKANALPVSTHNPLERKIKPLLADRVNNLLCNFIIGTPKSINKQAGFELVYEKFWNTKHRRINLAEQTDFGLDFQRKMIAIHTFRMMLCEKIAIILPLALFALSAIITLAFYIFI